MTAQILKIKLNKKELKAVRDVRESNGYTHADMAKKLDVSRTHYSMFETGLVETLGYDEALKIYNIFGNHKDLDFLLCGQEPLRKDSEQILKDLKDLIKRHE